MNEAKQAEIRKWLIKARHDLGSARRLMEGDEPYLDTAVYHCQQAAEKALKALLTYHDVSFEKTHDLTELLALSAKADPALDRWRIVAQELTPYAVRFRYPGDVLEPSRSEAEQALQHAQALVDFIWRLLPKEVKP
jgi:HEPN domain-containing protein